MPTKAHLVQVIILQTLIIYQAGQAGQPAFVGMWIWGAVGATPCGCPLGAKPSRLGLARTGQARGPTLVVLHIFSLPWFIRSSCAASHARACVFRLLGFQQQWVVARMGRRTAGPGDFGWSPSQLSWPAKECGSIRKPVSRWGSGSCWKPHTRETHAATGQPAYYGRAAGLPQFSSWFACAAPRCVEQRGACPYEEAAIRCRMTLARSRRLLWQSGRFCAMHYCFIAFVRIRTCFAYKGLCLRF
jgi:hypothetical protein